MEGDITSSENKGIIPRTVEALFDGVGEAEETIEFTFKVSYVEIYMEKIRDLLDETRTKGNLTVREDKLKGIYIAGVTEEYVTSIDELYYLMDRGASNRATAATGMNEGSSRSHSAFTLTVSQRNTLDNSSKSGKLVLVDLAGSEMVRKTGSSGQQLEEAKTINKSLSALGQVIYALTDEKATHVPYRDSKLTRVLQDSLGGNSKTVLIVNISPSSYNAMESSSTLRFGTRAKSIENKVVINQVRSVEELQQLLIRAEKAIDAQTAHIISLVTQINVMRARIESLEHGGESDEDESGSDALSGSSSEEEGSGTDNEDNDETAVATLPGENSQSEVDAIDAAATAFAGRLSIGGRKNIAPAASPRPESDDCDSSLDTETEDVATNFAANFSIGDRRQKSNVVPPPSPTFSRDSSSSSPRAFAHGGPHPLHIKLSKSHSQDNAGTVHHAEHSNAVMAHAKAIEGMQESQQKLQDIVDSLTEELDDERQESRQKEQQIQSLTIMLRDKDRLLHDAGSMLMELNISNEDLKKRSDKLLLENQRVSEESDKWRTTMSEEVDKGKFNMDELEASRSRLEQENAALKKEISIMSGDMLAAKAIAAAAVSPKPGNTLSPKASRGMLLKHSKSSNHGYADMYEQDEGLYLSDMVLIDDNEKQGGGLALSVEEDEKSKLLDKTAALKCHSAGSADKVVVVQALHGDRESILHSGNTKFAAKCVSLNLAEDVAAELFAVFDGVLSAMNTSCQTAEEKLTIANRDMRSKVKVMDDQSVRLEQDLQTKIATVILLQKQADELSRGTRGTALNVEDADLETARQRSLQQRLEQLVAVHRQLLRKYGTLELECAELKKKTRLRDERIRHLETTAKAAITTGRVHADNHLSELSNLREAMRLLKTEHEKRMEAFKQDMDLGSVGGARVVAGGISRTMQGGGKKGGVAASVAPSSANNISFYKKSSSPSGKSFYKTSFYDDSTSTKKISSFNSFYFANSGSVEESAKNMMSSGLQPDDNNGDINLLKGTSQKTWESNPMEADDSPTTNSLSKINSTLLMTSSSNTSSTATASGTSSPLNRTGASGAGSGSSVPFGDSLSEDDAASSSSTRTKAPSMFNSLFRGTI